jgi:hypothetical protein
MQGAGSTNKCKNKYLSQGSFSHGDLLSGIEAEVKE